MKALLISIHPEHALNILNGSKTLELRKSVPKGYVGWVYGYVTKGKPRLFKIDGFDDYNVSNLPPFYGNTINGTIPFRFWFDEYIKLEWLDPSLNIKRNDVNYYNYYALFENIYNNVEWILPNLCLTKQQVIDYGKERDLYAWHIKKLEIFDKPMMLEEFQNYMPKSNDIPEALITSSWQILHQPLTKAPQSWQYVYVKGE